MLSKLKVYTPVILFCLVTALFLSSCASYTAGNPESPYNQEGDTQMPKDDHSSQLASSNNQAKQKLTIMQFIKNALDKWAQLRSTQNAADKANTEETTSKTPANESAEESNTPATDEGYSLDPDDPRLDRPTITPIIDGSIPGDPRNK